MNIIIYILEKSKSFLKIKEESSNNINIYLAYSNLNHLLIKELGKIKNLLLVYDDIKEIKIVIDNKIPKYKVLHIITKFHDLVYDMKISVQISKYNNYFQELTNYKDIVINPNKTPQSFLQWILSNIPSNYTYKLYESSDDFALLKSVAIGSEKPFYFVHIKPQIINEKKNIYLIGKAITYDSGGLNLKPHSMHEMKTDMIGSAIILTVLRLLSHHKLSCNTHLIIPIAENMIGPNATKPGTVITTKYGKTVEIINTDAEGRLCIADGLEYVENELIGNSNEQNLIIDIATLTGNASRITHNISCISMNNKLGKNYNKILQKVGEQIGEYVDILKLHNEYNDLIKSKIADIKNVNEEVHSGCVLGGVFLSHFVKSPWIHIDIANVSYVNEEVKSFGINLLYQFLLAISSN